MDAASFGRVYDSFQDFHSFFAASFARKQWREHSRNYLRALLVRAQERRNAGNLSESVGISARAMQRFLTGARWSDDTVTGRLQKYLAPRLGHPEAVWVLDGSDFPKQGRKSAGVARQYCGRLGKAANCAFGAVERLRMPMPDGGIGHAEVEIGGAALMPSDALSPEYPPTSILIHLYVADCEAVYAQALAAGANSVAEPADQFYGDRLARITDPNGNHWSISTHIEDLTPDQVAERLAELANG